MDLTTHKLLAAIGLTLADALRSSCPAPRRPRLRLRRRRGPGCRCTGSIRRRASRSLQSRESRFGSKAVIGLESMRDLASLKSTYRFEHVQAVPALHAAVVTVDETRVARTARVRPDRSARPLRLAARPDAPRARTCRATRCCRPSIRRPRCPFEWQFASRRTSSKRSSSRRAMPEDQGRRHRHRRRHRPRPQGQGRRPLRGQPLRDAAFALVAPATTITATAPRSRR